MAKASLAKTAKAFMERVCTPDHLLGFVQRYRRLREVYVLTFLGNAFSFSLHKICTGDGFKHDGFRHETKEEEHPVEVLVSELLLSRIPELCMSRRAAWFNYTIFMLLPLPLGALCCTMHLSIWRSARAEEEVVEIAMDGARGINWLLLWFIVFMRSPPRVIASEEHHFLELSCFECLSAGFVSWQATTLASCQWQRHHCASWIGRTSDQSSTSLFKSV